jgi:hypothetical protein
MPMRGGDIVAHMGFPPILGRRCAFPDTSFWGRLSAARTVPAAPHGYQAQALRLSARVMRAD